MLEYIPRAVRKLKQVSGSDTFNLLGWCIGAMLSTLYASLRGNSEGLKSLILLTAPLDFTDKEQISLARMTEERYFDVDRVLQAFGNMPAGLIDYGAKMLKPVENFVGGYLRLLDNLDNPKVVDSWHAMNTWVNDAIPLAGGAYRQFIVDFYRGNKLMNGTLTIRGEKVDLNNLRASLLNVHAALPVGEAAGQGGEPGQAGAARARRTHRRDGGQRGVQGHLAQGRVLDRGALGLSRARWPTSCFTGGVCSALRP